jgi:hypothetical protein
MLIPTITTAEQKQKGRRLQRPALIHERLGRAAAPQLRIEE